MTAPFDRQNRLHTHFFCFVVLGVFSEMEYDLQIHTRGRSPEGVNKHVFYFIFWKPPKKLKKIGGEGGYRVCHSPLIQC